ncbi:MAG: hypothetical protein V1808_01935 [Candidatus Daviesbacteria bacterium]
MSLEDKISKLDSNSAPENSRESRKTTKFLTILREDLPCWFELGWEETNLAIVLRIHHDFLKNMPIISPHSPLVKMYIEELGLDEFSGNFSGNIGFNDALKLRGEKGDFREYHFAVPKIKKETEEKCMWCNGTGKNRWQDTCLSCRGSGKEHDIDWTEAYSISASLSTFTRFLQYCDEPTSASLPQLLTIGTITQRGMNGGSLGGEVSSSLRDWLTFHKGQNTLPEITRAMMLVHDKMFGLTMLDNYYFKAVIREDGGLMLDCPGNACGLHPEQYMREGRGYELGCHNVDSPLQQLTLIAGLAALHDKARQEMGKSL